MRMRMRMMMMMLMIIIKLSSSLLLLLFSFYHDSQVLSRFRHPNLVILMGFARHAECGTPR